jgi:hypothetical protein
MARTVGVVVAALCVGVFAVFTAGCPAFVEDRYNFAEPRPENTRPSPCAEDEVQFDDRCYFVASSPADFDAAQENCERRGNEWGLVEIGTREEHDFVVEQVAGEEAWLGATDRATEGEWVWNSGRALWDGDESGNCLAEFCQWDEGEPNDNEGGDCARMVDAVWRDTPCDEEHIAVCEQVSSGPPG